MHKETISIENNKSIELTWVHTLVVGSGAAGLNAAAQLSLNGIEDVMILTEGLQMGTSINTGSDKQTYYKLSMYGEDSDSPKLMAETYFSGGSMHGDLALIEASLSARAFSNLVNLGVPFPRDRYGQFVGYKTDHDPRQRATSIGPYTSREMCRALIRQIKLLEIPVRENRNVVELLVDGEGEDRRIVGVIAINDALNFEAYGAENVVFAVGGPGGLYKTSVYPEVQTGGIGLALMAGAKAQSLPESQYGMASAKFRWNVSGTYMQVIPRFISTSMDGSSDEREFMRDYFSSADEMNSMIFLKGYQWPFDARKVCAGSSIIDILVYIETVKKGRRVFLDYRSNSEGYTFGNLSLEAKQYLEKSNAVLDTPIDRLERMNPGAIKLYQEHGIDITKEPLEIAICAQHNNGGLAGNIWWESVNIKHLFPVGEVNGSHGVYRPGGSALNAGQVGSIRAAEYISHRYNDWTLPPEVVYRQVTATVQQLVDWLKQCENSERSWRVERQEFQERMTRTGAHIRAKSGLATAVGEAWEQWQRIRDGGCGYSRPEEMIEVLRNRQLCFAHAIYLNAILFGVESSVGSRGSSITLGMDGQKISDCLGDEWRIIPENVAFREKVLETLAKPDGEIVNMWIDRRPIPETNSWFETAWADFRSGKIYQ